MRSSRRILSTLLVTGLIFAVSGPALAARSYLVELVVFSNSDAGNAEKWTAVHPPLAARKMARTVRPGDPELVQQVEPAEVRESTFSSYVNKLRRNSAREVILSTHWVQPVLGPASTMIVRISDAADSAIKQTDVTAGRPVPARSERSNTAPMQPTAVPLLDGFINFYLDGQYTLEADLRYTPPYRPSILDENPGSGPISYRIYEKRRMKSGEINYYDHPKFGMLLLVTPVASPAQ